MSSTLPGELHPVPFEAGRALTEDEVIGVNRRLDGRRPTPPGAVGAPPMERLTDALAPVAFRMPRSTMAWAKARADTDGRTLSDVVRQLIDEYGHAPMGTVPVWVSPERAALLRGSGEAS